MLILRYRKLGILMAMVSLISSIQPTAFDPDVPIIAEGAEIISIDRLEAPYNPTNLRYFAKGLSWEAFSQLIE